MNSNFGFVESQEDERAEVLASIGALRRGLDELEKQVRRFVGVPPARMPLRGWLRLHGYPQPNDVKYKNVELYLDQGYSFEEIVTILKYGRKKSFLPAMERFCRERVRKLEEGMR